MNFSNQINLDNYMKNIGLKGSPAAAVYQDKLYVIYSGAGGDGVYYVTYDGDKWIGPTKLAAKNIGIADNTSPSAVVAHGLLHVFYNGVGNDGTYYITFDGKDVKGPVSMRSYIGPMKFTSGTSPAAISYGSNINLFWVDTDKNDKEVYYSIFSRKSWTGQTRLKNYVPGLGIADGTSPCGIEYMADYYLFYNGVGDDGTFYTSQTNEGWQVQRRIGEMGFRKNTSPSTCLSGGSYQLLLFWAGAGQDGIYVTSFDGTGDKTWTKQQRISCPNGAPGILDGTSPCAITYKQMPYLFWSGSGKDGIWMTTIQS